MSLCGSCGRVYSSVGPKGDPGTPGTNGAALKETVLANTAMLTLTGPDTGSLVLLDRATGVDVILPTAPADGTIFTFETKTEPSGGAYAINTGGADIFAGFVVMKEAATIDALFTATAGTERLITLNGTTSGGLFGTSIDVVYEATGATWYASGQTYGSGVTVTPFS